MWKIYDNSVILCVNTCPHPFSFRDKCTLRLQSHFFRAVSLTGALLLENNTTNNVRSPDTILFNYVTTRKLWPIYSLNASVFPLTTLDMVDDSTGNYIRV